MQHETSIKQILYQYNYDFSNINFKTNAENILDQIQTDLIQKPIGLEESRKIVAAVWRYTKNVSVENLKNGNLKETLNQIKQDKYYLIDKNFIVYRKAIPCKAIKRANIFYVLTSNQIQKISDLGYGIKSFKTSIDTTIKELFCVGKHPNLNSSSGVFCFDDDLRNIEFTIENLNLIKCMLSQFNLDSGYIRASELEPILEIIDGKKEKSDSYYL